MAGEKKVAAGTYLFREGEPPDAMYIIKSGSFAVTKAKGTQEVILAEINAGGMVGEMALFDKKPRSANIKAIKDSEVIVLPYDALEGQLKSLPVWVTAIMRTLNENLREANKKIKILENPSATEEDRYPPHVINRLLSIINLIGWRYGQKEGEGVQIPSNRLRNYTIQVFHEATNKMESMKNALKELGLMTIEDLGEGKQKIVNLQPELLFNFVDWYNEWLFKQEKDKVHIAENEIKFLNAIIHFAKKNPPNSKGLSKANLTDVQNDSMRDLGFQVKSEDINSLIEKKVFSEKIMEETGVYVNFILADLEPIARYWTLLYNLKKFLK